MNDIRLFCFLRCFEALGGFFLLPLFQKEKQMGRKSSFTLEYRKGCCRTTMYLTMAVFCDRNGVEVSTLISLSTQSGTHGCRKESSIRNRLRSPYEYSYEFTDIRKSPDSWLFLSKIATTHIIRLTPCINVD